MTEDQKEAEIYRLSLQKQLEDHKFKLAETLEQTRRRNEQFIHIWNGMFEYGQIAIRTVILVNGAGVTAILTLLGIVEKQPGTLISRYWLGLAVGCFATGVMAGFMASMFAYLSQFKLAIIIINSQVLIKGEEIPIGIRWERKMGVISVCFGFLMLLTGVAMAVHAFLMQQ